jgi:predicted YcjX-like family ATPase
MSWLNWLKTTEARVGVVGTANSGKTVLLTALIDHLKHHNPERFRLGRAGTRVSLFKELPPDAGWSKFNFEAHRNGLVQSRHWPRKTADRSQFVCQFDRDDWRFNDCLLKLYDLPGERIADAAMLGRTFAEWSAHHLHRIESDAQYLAHCAEYLEAARRPGATEAELLSAYRLALARLVLSYKPLISPSAFVLDARGGCARRGTAEELAAARLSGASADAQFCPLPPERCAPGDPVFAAFAARFESYTRELVEPTLAAFRSCSALVILLDVTTVLMGGAGFYNDTQQMVGDLFDALDPGERPVFGALARRLSKTFVPHAWRPGWITRAAFVAPKADLVHPDDRDTVLRLLRDMVEPRARDCTGLTWECFNVASVCSAQERRAGGPRAMRGFLLRGPDGRVRKEPGEAEDQYTVSQPPDGWPLHHWPAHEYLFPEVFPRVPARRDYPPDHLGLDALASFVIE